MKKFRLLLCFVICLLGLSACSPEKPVDPEKEVQLQSISEYIVKGVLANMTEESVDYFKTMGPEYIELQFENAGLKVNGNGMLTGFDSWLSGTKELGAFKDLTGYDVKYNSKGDAFVVNADVSCENGTAKVELNIKDNYYMEIESVAFNINHSFGEKMKTAALNTLMGMGTVFIILIIIMIVISCFNYIPKIQGLFRKEEPAAPVKEEAVVSEESAEYEEVTDDTELIAVISAAIAAYEGTAVPTGPSGYVVRSIRRRK